MWTQDKNRTKMWTQVKYDAILIRNRKASKTDLSYRHP